ncbi:MFS transporter [Dactylosporangium sp. NPDC000521]|uniref:MFS transporter n=1 Tax=Dactylosporangium sp. NPDC000521 TaxID=3363975 RepID=UPI003683A62D
MIIACQLLVVLDATVVNVALPRIQADLGFGPADLSWILTAYTLAFGGLLLLGGRAGDILGRRRVFVAGVILFTAASLLGGLATSPGTLLAARALQGVGAAFAAPSTLALIATNFPDGTERNKALGIFSTIAGFGMTAGLILSGVLVAAGSWRLVMFINVPIGLAIAVLAPRFVAEPQRHSGQFDVIGALTSTVGMTALVYGFIQAATAGWTSSTTIISFAIAIVLLAAFLIDQARATQPIMPLRLFSIRNRAAAYLNMLLLPATTASMFYFLLQYLQDVKGYSPLIAGVAFIPLAVVLFLAARRAPKLLPRYGARPIMITGTALITVAIIALSLLEASSSYWVAVLVPTMLFGAGVGLSFMPLNMTILAGVDPKDAGAASGLLQAMQQVGASLGLAILVTAFNAVFNGNNADHASFTAGVSRALEVSAVFSGLALLIALFVIRTKKS